MKKVVVSSSLNKRLISRLMASRPVTNTDKNFTLKGTNDFTSRSNDVFGELKTLEVAHESWISQNKTHEHFPEDNEREKFQFNKPPCFSDELVVDVTKQKKRVPDTFSFKKPVVPKRNSGHVIHRNRKKWTKYSLEDTPLSSNETNTSTALAFIDELRKRKMNVQEKEFDGNEKLVFSKPKKKRHSKLVSSTSLPDVDLTDGKKSKDVIRLDHLEFEED